MRLVATQSILIGGQILTTGKLNAAGNGTKADKYGGNGGNAAVSGSSSAGSRKCRTYSCGGHGGKGEGGAGGGVLLQAPSVTVTGTINTHGSSGATNGGTVKVFAVERDLSGTITTGRLYESN